MKKVLLIAFDFPPRRTSGVYRPTAFAKHLLGHGWQATVLTIAGDGIVQDDSLLHKLPAEVQVVRTPYWRLRAWETQASEAIRSLAPRPSQSGQHLEIPFRSELRKLAHWLQYALYFPDESAGWIPFALEKAVELHFRERFDAVYTTHPPRAAHLVGLMLKALCGVPWVAEFRDPWALPPDSQPIVGLKVPAASRNRWLLRRLVRRADAIIPVTEGHADELRRVWGTPAAKVNIVPNGYDEDDFSLSNGHRPDWITPDHVHLCHFGTIYPQFHGTFFPALLQAAQSSPEVHQRLRVHIIGFPSDEVREYSKREELKEILFFHSFLPHADALEAMRASDCLLLFYGHRHTSSSSIPGKTYEFLRMGRPLLVLAYEGGLKLLVEEAAAGWVLQPDDTQAIQNLLVSLARRTVEFPRPASGRFVAQFRYDRLAGQLASTLDHIARKEK